VAERASGMEIIVRISLFPQDQRLSATFSLTLHKIQIVSDHKYWKMEKCLIWSWYFYATL